MKAQRCRLTGGSIVAIGLTVPAFAEDIRDVRPPVDLPADYFIFILLAVILAAVLLFLLGRLLVKKTTSRAQPPVIVRVPWEVAYENLDQLKAQNLPGQGKIKEYYSRLSDIVRHYLEDRFLIRAPEMTTEEFLAHTRRTQALAARHKEALSRFLQCCDMVKFAKHASDGQEMENSFTVARQLVDETKENITK